MQSVRHDPDAYLRGELWWQHNAVSIESLSDDSDLAQPLSATAARHVPVNRRSVTGRYPSQKNQRMVAYESTAERDLLECLEFAFEVKSYQEQPLCIRYKQEGSMCTYIPDVLVEFADSCGLRRTLVEVKYASDLLQNYDQYRARFRAAREFARHHRLDFVVRTEKDIRTAYLHNAKLLLPYRRIAIPRDKAFALVREVTRHSHTVATLIFYARAMLDEKSAQDAVLHLIARGVLITDFTQLITDDSQLEPGDEKP